MGIQGFALGVANRRMAYSSHHEYIPRRNQEYGVALSSLTCLESGPREM